MTSLIIILTTIVVGAVGSRFVPTEDLLQDQFSLGQKYYAANDHENAVEIFNEIERTPNYALLEVDAIQVSIGEQTMPIRVAAAYQLGNSHRNVGRTKLERARNAVAEGDSLKGRQRWGEGVASFEAAKVHYRRLVEDTSAPRAVRVMAQYQIVRANYQMESYGDVVGASQVLLERFPGSDYEESALYDRAWAYYHMGDFAAAIGTFERMLGMAADVVKIDRAIYQAGESHFELGAFDAARAMYGRLVDKYDFGAMSEDELKAMETERFRGLVQETTRELVAKAQIRIGDAYAEEERIDEAVAAYSLVPQRYPQETLLVQKSYGNMAEMVFEQQGVDAGITVLGRAIDQVEDPVFRGRSQARIAGVLYEDGRFAEALQEYEVFVRAYGDEAAAVGFTLDRVLFMEGECHRALGRQARERDRAVAAESHFGEAVSRYRSILSRHPRSERVPEALFGMGRAFYALGQADSARAHFRSSVEGHPAAPVAPHALSWQGQMEFLLEEHDGAQRSYERLLSVYPGAGLNDRTWKDLGLLYKSTNRMDEAIEAFSNVDEDFELWTKVQADMADLLLAAGRLDEIPARIDFDRVTAKAAAEGDEETLAELHYVQGRIARERDDRAAQIEHFGAALARVPESRVRSLALFFRGLAHYSEGMAADAADDSLTGTAHFEAAVDDLQRLLDAGVSAEMRPIAYRTRGVALTRLGRSSEAVSAYRTLIESAASDDERTDFELMLMELYYDQGQLAQTEQMAAALLAAPAAGQGGADARRKAERAYMVLVSIMMSQERYDEALATATQALRRHPDSQDRGTLMLVRAQALLSLEEYPKAASAFDRFTQEHPRHPDVASAYMQLGYAREILGEYGDAAAAYQRAGERLQGTEVADALFRAGENLYNDSRFEEALERYLEVAQRYPGSPAAEQALYSAAWTYLDLDRDRASIETMARLVADYPHSDYARFAQFSIGDYHYSRKEYESAQNAYEKVVALYGETPEAQNARSLLTDLEEDMASRDYEAVFADFERRKYKVAVQGFEDVYEKYPRSYSALAALANKGVALEHLGDKGRARETYEQIMQTAADDPDKDDIAEFARLRLENL